MNRDSLEAEGIIMFYFYYSSLICLSPAPPCKGFVCLFLFISHLYDDLIQFEPFKMSKRIVSSHCDLSCEYGGVSFIIHPFIPFLAGGSQVLEPPHPPPPYPDSPQMWPPSCCRHFGKRTSSTLAWPSV